MNDMGFSASGAGGVGHNTVAVALVCVKDVVGIDGLFRNQPLSNGGVGGTRGFVGIFGFHVG
jgi:hypothetical protein